MSQQPETSRNLEVASTIPEEDLEALQEQIEADVENGILPSLVGSNSNDSSEES